RRGLYLVDNGEAEQSVTREVAGLLKAPFARADKQVAKNPVRDAIDRELAWLEEIAKQRGSAVGVAAAYPVTIDRVSTWAGALEQRGIALAPVTAVIARPGAPQPAELAPAASEGPPPGSAGGPADPQPPAAPRQSTRQKLPTNPEPAFETAPHP